MNVMVSEEQLTSKYIYIYIFGSVLGHYLVSILVELMHQSEVFCQSARFHCGFSSGKAEAFIANLIHIARAALVMQANLAQPGLSDLRILAWQPSLCIDSTRYVTTAQGVVLSHTPLIFLFGTGGIQTIRSLHAIGSLRTLLCGKNMWYIEATSIVPNLDLTAIMREIEALCVSGYPTPPAMHSDSRSFAAVLC
jgi:hypothetical protein